MRRRTLLALTALPAAAPVQAQAPAWTPTRPVRLIVPYPPGSATDTVGRTLAERMRETLGGAMVVENRGGSGGIVGTEAAARAAPDGHTVLLGASGVLAIAPHLHAALPYAVERDLAPVSLAYSSDLVICVAERVAARSLPELIALARARAGASTGALTYASSGAGTSAHVATELFRLAAGIELLHVPYRGSGPAMSDFLAGRVDLMVDQVAGPIAAIRDGRIRALAVTGEARHPLLPDVATVAEAGLPGARCTSWGAFMVPAGTPPEAVARLAGAASEAASHRPTRQRIGDAGVDPAASTPAELAAFLRAETDRWGRVVREARITLG